MRHSLSEKVWGQSCRIFMQKDIRMKNQEYFLKRKFLIYEKQILNFRRNSDPRYYKGVEFADILEELARRRCAELFANKFL